MPSLEPEKVRSIRLTLAHAIIEAIVEARNHRNSPFFIQFLYNLRLARTRLKAYNEILAAQEKLKNNTPPDSQ